jgi:hypothetical protein
MATPATDTSRPGLQVSGALVVPAGVCVCSESPLGHQLMHPDRVEPLRGSPSQNPSVHAHQSLVDDPEVASTRTIDAPCRAASTAADGPECVSHGAAQYEPAPVGHTTPAAS